MTSLAGLTLNGGAWGLATAVGTSSGGGGGSGATLTTFGIQNWGMSASAPFLRAGIAFPPGDIPAGSVPVVAGAQAVQFDNRAPHPDGSLRFAVVHARDASVFSALENRSYAVSKASGSYNNAGSLTLAGLLAGHDFRLTFAGVQQTGNAGISARGSGAFTASLNVAIATATRITKVHSGPVCEGWVVWAMARDNAGGAEDPDLKAYWYVDAWKASDGSVYAIEIGAVVAQDRWDSTTKRLLSYDATLLDGGSTIGSYPGVQHPYHSTWLTCKTALDNNTGRLPWVGAAIPTLIYKPDVPYWIKSGVLPPIDTTITPTVSPLNAYVPCQSCSNDFTQDHRVNIDGTGYYLGRGLMGGKFDFDAWLLRTPLAYAKARVSAHAGLGVPYHYRSTRMRTRPGESADTASTPISPIMGPDASSTYDFTPDGMPSPVQAYTMHPNTVVGDAHQDGYVDPQGGSGVWSPSIGASHAVSYSSGMYRLEGAYYHLEATLDLCTNLFHQLNYNYNGSRGSLLAGAAEFSSLTIPNTRYDAIAGLWDEYNQRSPAWACNILGEACGLIGADHVAYRMFQKLLSHNGDWISASLTSLPADMIAQGYFGPSLMANEYAYWMVQGFITQGAIHAWRMTGDTRYRDLGFMTGNGIVGVVAGPALWLGGTYRVSARAKSLVGWNVTTNPFLTPAQLMFCGLNVQISGSTISMSSAGLYWDASGSNVLPLTNGDAIRFSSCDQNMNADYPTPSEITDGELLYIRDLSSAAGPCTFKLARAPGGTPITFATSYTTYNAYTGTTNRTGIQAIWLDWIPQSAGAYTVASTGAGAPYTPGADSYEQIAAAAFALARGAGHPGATSALNAKVQMFTSAIDKRAYSPWALVAA